jgi:cyclopropane-fatty-acyl-phospholipid synthase
MDRSMMTTRRVLAEFLSGLAVTEVGVRLWDGSRWPDENPRPTTLVLNHPGALRRMFLSRNDVGLAEAYLYDDFDIQGDLEPVFPLAEGLAHSAEGLGTKLRLARNLLRLPRNNGRPTVRRGPAQMRGKRHSIERDRRAIEYHYNVSNDFYSLWLDKNMVYSCAYFHTAEDSLDRAQENKLEHICRKLRLRPGQRLLDIGCGWGGLIIYAAQHYGVEATGITLSQPQADLANQRIAQAGLEHRCRAVVRDYRELDEAQGFDALASVGMFEHVGAALLQTYFQQAWRLLRTGGLFLNHGITHRVGDALLQRRTFSSTYVFPDGELVPISSSLQIAESVGFEVRDVESLREHYAFTLRHWVHRLEAEHKRALQFVDEPTYRVWRLFISGSAYGFTIGRLNVHQALLVKPGSKGQSGLPLTRMDLYTQ